MVLQSAEKFPSMYQSNGKIRELVPSYVQCLIKLCFVALIVNIIPLIGGFITNLVDEADLSLAFVMNTVQALLLTFAIPFARVKILHLFWSVKDVDDFEEETHVASLAGKQAFARSLAAWIEGIYVLTNGISITSFFDGDSGATSKVFGSLTALFTLLHMIGYVGVFLTWMKYRHISDMAVDSEKAKVEPKVVGRV